MPDIRAWSFATVALASVVWILFIVFLVVAYFGAIYVRVRRQAKQIGAGGIGAVSGGFGEWFALAVLFVPPLGLVVAWYFLRRS